MTSNELQVPDYAAPLMGVREWSVIGDGDLESIVTSNIWKVDHIEEASCWSYPDHDAPIKECDCGLYAFYDLETCTDQNLGHIDFDCIKGVVSAGGKVILAEYGFRAESMKLEAIILNTETIFVLGTELSVKEAYENIAHKYNVPLIEVDEVEDFCQDRGVVLEPEEEEEEDFEYEVNSQDDSVAVTFRNRYVPFHIPKYLSIPIIKRRPQTTTFDGGENINISNTVLNTQLQFNGASNVALSGCRINLPPDICLNIPNPRYFIWKIRNMRGRTNG